jgi:hypothetical protein
MLQAGIGYFTDNVGIALAMPGEDDFHGTPFLEHHPP